MRFDSPTHLFVLFVALVAIYFILKALNAYWLSKKEAVKANLLCYFTRLLSNDQPQVKTLAVLPTGYTADSMASAHADLNKLAAFLKAK